MSPQDRDQSNRDQLKEVSNWFVELSKSSNICLLRSFRRHHNKHNETKFQMLEESFSNWFHQPKSKSGTVLGRTHEIQKDLKTKLHNQWAFSQWSSKWSTVSPQCLPTVTTHNALVNKIKTPKSQIITHKNLIPSYNPNEEGNTSRGLNFPNNFPRKDNRSNLL